MLQNKGIVILSSPTLFSEKDTSTLLLEDEEVERFLFPFTMKKSFAFTRSSLMKLNKVEVIDDTLLSFAFDLE